MNKILPIGNLQEIDEEGYIINETHNDYVVSPWSEAVNEIKTLYLDYLGEFVHSIYLRGSVARGLAIKAVSDIDTFALIFVDPQVINTAWIARKKHELEQKYDFSTGIEMELFYYHSMWDKNLCAHAEDALNLKFLLKTQSLCIHGEDLCKTLLPCKADIDTAKFLAKNLLEAIGNTKKAMINASRESIRQLCSWIMKLIVRSGFILVMDKGQGFTRDLYPSYRLFSKYFPEQEQEMKRALEFAINPIDDPVILSDFLERFGLWLHDRMQNKFCMELLSNVKT